MLINLILIAILSFLMQRFLLADDAYYVKNEDIGYVFIFGFVAGIIILALPEVITWSFRKNVTRVVKTDDED
jgi:hypothetical protein